MEYTATERILLELSNPEVVPLSLAQIISEEIKEFKASQARQNMIESEGYYRNRSDVQRKTVRLEGRSNAKIERPILKKLIDQKTDFLLSKPFTVNTENEAYGAAINTVFDAPFRRRVKAFGKQAILSGIAYLQPWFDEGKLAFSLLPSAEVIPLWADDEHEKLSAFIRFYDRTVYIGNRRCTVSHAELWWPGGVKYFKTDAFSGPGATDYKVDTDHGTAENDYTEPHFTVGNKAYNWETPPLVWVRYNTEELPLCYFVKDLIDDINWQNSVTADVLRDVAKFVYILKNYGGQDLGDFIRELREAYAIQVEGDGGVDKLAADVSVDAVMAFLDNDRRDLFDYASAVDTKDPDLGNASGVAINFRYMDLAADCDALGTELKAAFARLKLFIDYYLALTGKGDFANDSFEVVFNTDMPVNEADVINNARNSAGLISRQTIVENHPWVVDAQEELRRLEAEQQQTDVYAGAFGAGGGA